MTITIPLDEATIGKMKACKNAEFPLCLENTLHKVFGENRSFLDLIAEKNGLVKSSITSPRQVWDLYERYVAALGKGLGKDVAQMIEFESLRQMESMLCTSCPLYEREIKKETDLLKEKSSER